MEMCWYIINGRLVMGVGGDGGLDIYLFFFFLNSLLKWLTSA